MIKRLRKELITNSIFNVPGREIITCPVWNDPLSLLRETIRDVERTVIQINEGNDEIDDFVFWRLPDRLIGLYNSIEQADICCDFWGLEHFSETLEEYLQYKLSDGLQYNDEEISELRMLILEIQNYLRMLEQEVYLMYKKIRKV